LLIEVETRLQNRIWRSVMQDASYLRSQAELCLRIARHIHDKNLAGKFRAAATQYFLRAESEGFRGDMCATRLANWPESFQPAKD
jgi:hypothetical protein